MTYLFTAGTQLKYKIEFANQATGQSKEARIRGVIFTILICLENLHKQ